MTQEYDDIFIRNELVYKVNSQLTIIVSLPHPEIAEEKVYKELPRNDDQASPFGKYTNNQIRERLEYARDNTFMAALEKYEDTPRPMFGYWAKIYGIFSPTEKPHRWATIQKAMICHLVRLHNIKHSIDTGAKTIAGFLNINPRTIYFWNKKFNFIFKTKLEGKGHKQLTEPQIEEIKTTFESTRNNIELTSRRTGSNPCTVYNVVYGGYNGCRLRT
jgi:hypothetical protein